MNKNFLITRPHHDVKTSYIHAFTKWIVALAQDEDINMADLEGPKATRENVEKAIKKLSPRLIFLNGHGTEDVVLGHKDQPVLDEKNVDLTKGKIVYALACDSLSKLGDIAISKGTEAYVGYEREFTWAVDRTKTSTPDKDKNAMPFRKVCFVLGKSLLSGTPVGESIKRTKREYRKLIRTYGTSLDNYGDAPLIGFALSWDLSFLNMRGNPEATF